MFDEGIFQFDKITIVPNMSSKLIEDSGFFQCIKLKTVTFYLAEVKFGTTSWDLRVMAHKGIIRSMELRMKEPTAAHNHLEEKYAAHNKFLRDHISSECKKKLGRTEYSFEWGSICSYMDIKTGECVISVEY